MGPEYSSDEAGDGPHSSDEYDSQDDAMIAMRKRVHKRKGTVEV